MPKRRKKSVPPPTPPQPPSGDEGKKERPTYLAVVVHLMDCVPATYDHAEGEPAVVVTIGRQSVIEPQVFNMKDARRLVTRLLVALATCDDKFAQKLLDDNFAYDDDGSFYWPTGTDEP